MKNKKNTTMMITKDTNMTKINTKIFAITLLFVMLSFSAIANGGVKTIKIKTSAICGMCKDRIELVVNNLDGVKKSMLNVDTKYLLVRFNSKKISELEIKMAISDAGYDADDIPKLSEAYDVLPPCCKKSGSCDIDHNK